jgi:hypothetical protein
LSQSGKKRDGRVPKKWDPHFKKDLDLQCGVSKISVSTPINVDRLESELENHPDKEFTKYLISGVRHGFDTGFKYLPTNSLQCKNLRSATANHQCVSELIGSEVDKGYLSGPFNEIPFFPYRVNPIGLAESKYSKKKRLIACRLVSASRQ